MLDKGRDNQRPVILHPKVAPSSDELLQRFLTFFGHIGGSEIFRMVPIPISATHRGQRMGSFAVNPKEEVDSGLLIGI